MSEDRRRTKKQPIDPTYGHIQPQAPEVEKAVLGALMIDKDAYVEVCEILRAESFYEPRHQKIYAAIQQLTVDEKPVDLLTVTEQLSKNGDLDEVGGPGYIADLSSRVATSANIEYHAPPPISSIMQTLWLRNTCQDRSFLMQASSVRKPTMRPMM